MFMQSNLGSYEVRRNSQTNEVSIVPISQEEYYNRTRNVYSTEEYDDYIQDVVANLTYEYDINTFFSVQRIINAINRNILQEASVKPKVSLENFEKLEKFNKVTDCGICFENMKDNIKLNCDHIYCNRCIKKWLTEKSNTCPTCRKEIII